MNMTGQMDRIRLFSISSVPMRTFHLTWLMFFICFFGWFGLAPLMPIIRADLGLTKVQVGNTIIASVSSTVIARLLIGRCCDVWGPRLTAVWLLVLGSVPVLLVAWLYYTRTQDSPEGNFRRGKARIAKQPRGDLMRTLADWRILALVLAYACCFGMEITFDNVASLYFTDNFHLGAKAAGLWAGVFGSMNLFARALGGIASDRAGGRW